MSVTEKKINLALINDTTDKRETVSRKIRLTAIAAAQEGNYPQLQSISIIDNAALTADVKANCYLQIWELDFYKVSKYLQDEETDTNARQNRRLATFPGVVVKTIQNGTTKYEFRPTAAPTLAFSPVNPNNGSICINLIPVGQTQEQKYTIPVSEFETVFELSAILRTSAEDNSYANYTNASPHMVHNLKATALRQIAERGGITVAFVSDYSSTFPNNNNEEFHRQAEEFISTLPSFKLNNGNLEFGYYLISSFAQISNFLQQTRNAVGNFLGLQKSPLVSTILIYGHGIRTKIKIDESGWNAAGSLTPAQIDTFVTQIKPHITESVIIPLFACNTGRSYCAGGNGGSSDEFYGKQYPCEIPGADSMAWLLLRSLITNGIRYPTIWAHTTSGHTTRNPFLRVFSRWLNIDFVDLLLERFSCSASTRSSYMTNFAFGSVTGDAYKQRLHNANLIRAISVQHIMYLPTKWAIGDESFKDIQGYSAGAAQVATSIYNELRGLVNTLAGDEHPINYEPGGFAYFTGLKNGTENLQLTEKFAYSEIKNLSNPFRSSVRLLSYLQILRSRTGKSMTPTEICENGDGIIIKVASTNLNVVLTEAQNMQRTKFFQKVEQKETDKVLLTLVPIRVFFSIYYKVADNAFKRASDTWLDEVSKKYVFDPVNDILLEIEVTTETEFKNAWKKIDTKVKSLGAQVFIGNLFTHASKDENDDGLEFKKDKTNDGTLTKKDIEGLEKLKWVGDGQLILSGCNTGLKGQRDWAPAQIFSITQNVKTYGQSGYAYFSQKPDIYEKIDGNSLKIYLHAYNRMKNASYFSGDNKKIDEQVFLPQDPFIINNNIVPRQAWGHIMPHYDKLDVEKKPFNLIVIHHSGDSGYKDPLEVEKKHMVERKYDDVGYHFMIKPDGTICEGRNLKYKGAHTKDKNEAALGILVMGDFQHQAWDIDDDVTGKQKSTIDKLIEILKVKYPSIIELGGHRDYVADTVCPGDELYKLLPDIRKKAGLSAPKK